MNKIQKAAMETVRTDLIEKVVTTQHVISRRKLAADGTVDFSTPPALMPLSREDVTVLVDEFLRLRLTGMPMQDAIRVTYGRAYRQMGYLNPHDAVDEIRNRNCIGGER